MVNRPLMHEGNEVREFYCELPRPVLVGIEAIGPMQWFVDSSDYHFRASATRRKPGRGLTYA